MRDKLGAKLINIKAYDKILDLVGREATFLVSTRLSKVLSSGSTPGAFERLISRNLHCGTTRLEMSICSEALDRCWPSNTNSGNDWHFFVGNAMYQLVDKVLNSYDCIQ